VKPSVFISHASEDKDSVARPLAETLRNRGFAVWFDEFVLEIGDSLMGSIDSGLAECEFGVVILSPAFFSKEWPRRELAGLLAREQDEKLILPVWHNLTASQVARHSPLLADRLAASTSAGTLAVADSIALAMRKRSRGELLRPSDYCLSFTMTGPQLVAVVHQWLARDTPFEQAPLRLMLYSDASGLNGEESYLSHPNGGRRLVSSGDILAALSREPYVPPNYAVHRWSVSDELPLLLARPSPQSEDPIDLQDVDQVHFTAVLNDEFLLDDELATAVAALVSLEDGLSYHLQGDLWWDPRSPGRRLARRMLQTGVPLALEQWLRADSDFSLWTMTPVSDYRVFCLGRAFVLELNQRSAAAHPEVVELLLREDSPLNEHWRSRLRAVLDGRPPWVYDETVIDFLRRKGFELDPTTGRARRAVGEDVERRD
jgi:hypothetical protein